MKLVHTLDVSELMIQIQCYMEKKKNIKTPIYPDFLVVGFPLDVVAPAVVALVAVPVAPVVAPFLVAAPLLLLVVCLVAVAVAVVAVAVVVIAPAYLEPEQQRFS